MLVVVSVVRRVPVPVVQIVQVVVVGDGAVAAPLAMDVIVPGGVVRPMPLVACHEAVLSGEDVDESALVSSGVVPRPAGQTTTISATTMPGPAANGGSERTIYTVGAAPGPGTDRP